MTAQTTILIELLGNGNLQSIAGLKGAADKGLVFTGAGTAATYDLTATARAFSKMTGPAAANKLPYFNADNGSALTVFTTLARNVLAACTGAAMLTAMGGEVFGNSTNGGCLWPNGELEQWGEHNKYSDDRCCVDYLSSCFLGCFCVLAYLFKRWRRYRFGGIYTSKLELGF
ncbi:hypothetical protein [Brucella gallinifaecis]|uniref:hypothetical protein n=1 Tax=Brucella gallinifaecis TaxID=215590 RepID=UPI002360F4E9|nr:hypothetical protein [Brucella gallinifaecis]